MRVSPEFFQLRNNLKTELRDNYGDISDTRFTRGIANFMVRENLDAYIIRKERKRGGGLF